MIIKTPFPFGKFKFQTKQTVLGESGEVIRTTKGCNLVLDFGIDKTCMFILAIHAWAMESLNIHVLECRMLIQPSKISGTSV